MRWSRWLKRSRAPNRHVSAESSVRGKGDILAYLGYAPERGSLALESAWAAGGDAAVRLAGGGGLRGILPPGIGLGDGVWALLAGATRGPGKGC